MSRRTLTWLLVGATVLALVAAGTLWFRSVFVRRAITVSQPDRGAARYDRFYVLRRLLQHYPFPARAISRLDGSLQRRGTLVIGRGIGRIGPAASHRLANWVRHGGHLVLTPEPWGDAVASPLFHDLGLASLKHGQRDCIDVQDAADVNAGEAATMQLCGRRFKGVAGMRPTAAVGDADAGYAYARLHIGAGTLSLLDTLGPLSGHAPLRATERRFDIGVLRPNLGKGTVYLAYFIDGPSFWSALLHQGWPALLALTLLLLAWASARSQRLGPLCPDRPRARRALLEHVRAAGEFLYRRDTGLTLHARAVTAVRQRLARRDPVLAELEGEALHERLAWRAGLDAERVARALATPANAAAFREALIVLVRLGRS